MRIHTDLIYDNHIWRAVVEDTGLAAQGVWLDKCEEHGSRSRARAFDVALVASPRPGRMRRRNMQHIKQDPPDVVAATYDEWGFFIRALFERDPDAIIGAYKGVDDFHGQTHGKFRFATPTDVDTYLNA